MGIRLLTPVIACALLLVSSSSAFAGKHGFADKEGGGKDDPIIEVSASVGGDQGALFSVTPDQANALYQFDVTNAAGPKFIEQATPPLIPTASAGRNHFLTIKFPFKISSSKVAKTIMKNKGDLAATSFLNPGITITDETGSHVRGIATIAGKTAQGTKIKNEVGFPQWLNAKEKNLLTNKKTFAYIADDGDGDVNSIAAFNSDASLAPPINADPVVSSIGEIRVRVEKVDGVIINGFWVLKFDDGTGNPAGSILSMSTEETIALSPVTPEKFDPNGNQIIETFTKFRLVFTEPVVPWSVGFSASDVKDFNASGPSFPLLYNGNTAAVPNIDPTNLPFQFQPNMAVQVLSPNNAGGYIAPYDVRPINPNNLAEYIINPLVDLPGKLDVNVTVIPEALSMPFSSTGIPYVTSVISLYSIPFDDAMNNVKTFQTNKGRGFVNAPVAPNAILYLPASGGGVGAINLDGNGLETNDPATEKLVLLTNNALMCLCPVTGTFAGSHLNGCNGNAFGVKATGMTPTGTAPPIGIAGNPAGTHLGPPTPFPGVNEGSVGSTAGNVYPPGFETVVKDSTGNPRLAQLPSVGALSDGEIGGFLDALFFDSDSFGALTPNHLSFVTGITGQSNFISDPPTPNPPPLRLPVGLPAIKVAFNQQKLLEPAFLIEGDEVWAACVGCNCAGVERVLLTQNPVNPLAGDAIPSYAQNGPYFQSFQTATAYAARQQVGNFLYVADRDFGGLTVLNSNTFSVIDRISLPDPWGVGMAPDLKRVYVSNLGDDSVSVIGTDPFLANFHKEIARVKVGAGPVAVSAQPDGEDIHICNQFGDSISVLDPNSLTIRTTYTGPMKRPVDVVLTPRLGNLGWLSGIYIGYVASQGTGDVLIYESGPDGADGFGADDIKWAVSQTGRFDQMAALAYDPLDPPGIATSFFNPTQPNPLLTGCYVLHQDEDSGLAMVTRVTFIKQLPGVGAFPNVPLPGSILNSPGVVQRIFEPVSTWGGPLVPFFSQINPGGNDQVPSDIAMSDITTINFHQPILSVGFNGNNYKTNLGSSTALVTKPAPNHKSYWRVDGVGAPIPAWIPDRMYVSFAGDNRVVVLDPTGTKAGPLNMIENVPTPGKLISWYDQ